MFRVDGRRDDQPPPHHEPGPRVFVIIPEPECPRRRLLVAVGASNEPTVYRPGRATD